MDTHPGYYKNLIEYSKNMPCPSAQTNKDTVIKMLIDDVFKVDLNLPPSILNKDEGHRKKRGEDDE